MKKEELKEELFEIIVRHREALKNIILSANNGQDIINRSEKILISDIEDLLKSL